MLDQIDNNRSTTASKGSVVNEWKIYHDVIGEPSYGHELGLGTGIKRQRCV